MTAQAEAEVQCAVPPPICTAVPPLFAAEDGCSANTGTGGTAGAAGGPSKSQTPPVG